jgi:hypothetical protein
MKNGVFWDVTACGSCKNRRFGGTYRLTTCGLSSGSQLHRVIVRLRVKATDFVYIYAPIA